MNIEGHAPVTIVEPAGTRRLCLAGGHRIRHQITQFGKLTRNGNFHIRFVRQE